MLNVAHVANLSFDRTNCDVVSRICHVAHHHGAFRDMNGTKNG